MKTIYDYPETDHTIFDPLDDGVKSVSSIEKELYPIYADYEIYIADQEYLQEVEDIIRLHGDDSL